MSETILERHYLDRMKSLGQLASLPEPERAALSWRDYQELVALCVELATAGRDLFESEFRRVFKLPHVTVAWLTERRRVIEELSDGFVRLAESVKAVASQAWQVAGRPPGDDFSARLDAAIKVMCEAKRSVLQRWLIGSPDEMAEMNAAIARGETLDIDEAFAEIAGTDVASWRERISAYRQTAQ